MKVKITKGKHWYKDKIGEIFEVTGTLNDDGKYSTTQESTDELLKTEEDQGVVGYFINSKHCEEVKEMPKFNIGDRVKLLDTVGLSHRYKDSKEATVHEYYNGSMTEIMMDDGETNLARNAQLELVEPQWMSKEAALKLCIDGNKVCNEKCHGENHHIYWDGEVFMLDIDGSQHKAMGVLTAKRWKLWASPTPPKPKFAVDELCLDQDLFYAVVVSIEHDGKQWKYTVSNSTKDNGEEFMEYLSESELTKLPVKA